MSLIDGWNETTGSFGRPYSAWLALCAGVSTYRDTYRLWRAPRNEEAYAAAEAELLRRRYIELGGDPLGGDPADHSAPKAPPEKAA